MIFFAIKQTQFDEIKKKLCFLKLICWSLSLMQIMTY
jgi:hypothetical protein